MPFVKAGPNQFLLAGRGGKLENLGSAVRPYLRPGTIHVLVPGTKQEATFEFTQETRDGIPLRFKGIVIYRITDPIAAARLFDFGTDAGVARITALLTHVCLGELRHAVSHMTMVECIEQRKTTLSEVAEPGPAGHDPRERRRRRRRAGASRSRWPSSRRSSSSTASCARSSRPRSATRSSSRATSRTSGRRRRRG